MSTADIIIRMLAAALLGGLIGVERELRDQAAGFRTHVLVSVGAAAFTLSSVYGFESFITGQGVNNVNLDPSRVAAQIVSGIGFLGAGAIIRHGASVRGLTTAASLWAVAAIGMAAGLGRYELAATTAIVVVASLYVLRFIERTLIRPRAREFVKLDVRFRGHGFGPLTQLVAALDAAHVAIHEMAADSDEAPANAIRLVLQLPRGMSAARLAELISSTPEVESITQR